MKSEQPKVSIITVNYNGTDTTAALLNSLNKISYNNWEVIVVDNASRKPCRELAEQFPNIIYIENKENLGFSGGNNVGIQAATGDYLLLLNNDTEVAPNFLEFLVNRFEQDPNIGVVSPKILYFDQPDTIQFAGFTPIHPITGRGFGIGEGEKDTGNYNTARPTSRAHGAAMMFSRKAFDKVGFMPEIFFLYYEEMDYCEQFKRAGFTIWYEPASVVWHKESISTGKSSTLKTYYYSRNRLLYLRRNTSKRYKAAMLLYYFFIAAPKNLLSHLAKREWQHSVAFWKGLKWNLCNSPKDKHDLSYTTT